MNAARQDRDNLKEFDMKTTSTTRKLTRFQYAATLLGALAFVALAPATANAQPVGSTGADGGCHYTDKDGYDIPIDDGQGVIVDGKTVTCNGGTITVSAAPSRSVGTKQPVLSGTPQKAPVLNHNAIASTAP
ncbi:MAG: hypothetical protein QOJ28_2815 [Mycobacterium sp.]|nr:hypothetical protein [Mycobacterium sp.]